MGKQLKPNEILDANIESGVVKAGGSFGKLFVLAIMAGAFIAFGAESSNMAAYGLLSDPMTFGQGKALAGALFAAGLMMVILCGGELFTGNCLMVTSLLDRRISAGRMLRNWVIVYIGNFVGGAGIAYLMSVTGLFASGGGALGAMTVKIAAGKCALTFGKAFVMGILCNILVCLAVWLATGADSTIGKIFGIFFPIWVFVTSGFEHSVANMYYVPAGIFAKGDAALLANSALSPELLSGLNWQNFLVANLVPVTLGNIVGGAIFVGCAYYFAYKKAK